MITGPQLYWIMEIDVVLTNNDAVTADGLWEGLDMLDKRKFVDKAALINNLFEGKT